MDLILKRLQYRSDSTIGSLIVVNDKGNVTFHCRTLELPWKDNVRNISCIPEGRYPIVYEYSPAFDSFLWELKEVHGRSEVKIHKGNFTYQIRGCILVGRYHTHINSDQIIDVADSKNTLDRLHMALAEAEHKQLEIEII